jgi:leukotriene-A4 hydrolase
MAQNEYSKTDRSSLSSIDSAVTKRTVLDWTLDFDAKTISGSAKHQILVLKDGVATVDFDSSNLTISKVTITPSPEDGEQVVSFVAAPLNPVLGTRISVVIPSVLSKEGTVFEVTFYYSTSPEASAVQWLDASATKGGKYPYVFTQCQVTCIKPLRLGGKKNPGLSSSPPLTAHIHS